MPAKKSIYRKVYKNNMALEVKFFQCSVTVCLRSVYVVSMFCLCSVYVPVMFHLYSMPLETLLASKALNPYTAERRDVSENTPPEAQESSQGHGFWDKDTLWTELFKLSKLFQFSMIFQFSEIFQLSVGDSEV